MSQHIKQQSHSGEISHSVGHRGNSSNCRVRVLLADDSAPVRERLRHLLGSTAALDIVGEAVDAPATTRAMQELQPHVVLLDLRMPGGGGFAVLRDLQQQSHAMTVMVLTNCADAAYQQKAARLGAHYFFDKSTQMEQMTQKLMEIAQVSSPA